jgi:hypothetical protein
LDARAREVEQTRPFAVTSWGVDRGTRQSHAAKHVTSPSFHQWIVEEEAVWQLQMICTFMVIIGALAASAVAEAKLVCDGPYLKTSQGEARTAYCEYNYLAQVAGKHGLHVTGDELRNSFSKMISVCQLVFSDNRVWDICENVNPGCFYFPCN